MIRKKKNPFSLTESCRDPQWVESYLRVGGARTFPASIFSKHLLACPACMKVFLDTAKGSVNPPKGPNPETRVMAAKMWMKLRGKKESEEGREEGKEIKIFVSRKSWVEIESEEGEIVLPIKKDQPDAETNLKLQTPWVPLLLRFSKSPRKGVSMRCRAASSISGPTLRFRFLTNQTEALLIGEASLTSERLLAYRDILPGFYIIDLYRAGETKRYRLNIVASRESR